MRLRARLRYAYDTRPGGRAGRRTRTRTTNDYVLRARAGARERITFTRNVAAAARVAALPLAAERRRLQSRKTVGGG
jgi:hypothetical protein